MAKLPEPACPPIVALAVGDEIVPAYLLCWEQSGRDGSWQAWVTWAGTAAPPPATTGQMWRLRPPSTTMRWPVTKPAPAEARKLTA